MQPKCHVNQAGYAAQSRELPRPESSSQSISSRLPRHPARPVKAPTLSCRTDDAVSQPLPASPADAGAPASSLVDHRDVVPPISGVRDPAPPDCVPNGPKPPGPYAVWSIPADPAYSFGNDGTTHSPVLQRALVAQSLLRIQRSCPAQPVQASR